MSHVLPGGKIISGIGGRIWVSSIPPGALAPTRAAFSGLGGFNPLASGSLFPPAINGVPNENYGKAPFLDIQQWSISKTTILARVPHSGCVGGITSRIIGTTWRWSASLPLDQSNFPESLLIQDKFALAFYLGDVVINPEAVYMGMTQSYYFSPRVCINYTNPVLNASGDVIRVTIGGEESCRLFLIPTEGELCDEYVTYLNLHRGWL